MVGPPVISRSPSVCGASLARLQYVYQMKCFTTRRSSGAPATGEFTTSGGNCAILQQLVLQQEVLHLRGKRQKRFRAKPLR